MSEDKKCIVKECPFWIRKNVNCCDRFLYCDSCESKRIKEEDLCNLSGRAEDD